MSLFYSRAGQVMQLPAWMAARTDPDTTTLASSALPGGDRLVTIWAGVDLGLSTASKPGDPVVLFVTLRCIEGFMPQPVACWETEEDARLGHDGVARWIGEGALYPPKRARAKDEPDLAEQERTALARLDEIRAMRGRG